MSTFLLNSIQLTYKIYLQEVNNFMSNIENGRKLVQSFMKKNKISEHDLATAYGKSRVWVQRALNGSDTGPAVNSFILELIRDYRIRAEKIEVNKKEC